MSQTALIVSNSFMKSIFFKENTSELDIMIRTN